MTDRIPTHRCKVCGCKWILWPAGAGGLKEATWSLGTNETCGPCCDNVAMGDQIETLADAYDYLQADRNAERLLRKGLGILLDHAEAELDALRATSSGSTVTPEPK